MYLNTEFNIKYLLNNEIHDHNLKENSMMENVQFQSILFSYYDKELVVSDRQWFTYVQSNRLQILQYDQEPEPR